MILWASSMIMYRQWNFLKWFFSLMTISYEVTTTSNLPGASSSFWASCNSNSVTYILQMMAELAEVVALIYRVD